MQNEMKRLSEKRSEMILGVSKLNAINPPSFHTQTELRQFLIQSLFTPTSLSMLKVAGKQTNNNNDVGTYFQEVLCCFLSDSTHERQEEGQEV